MKTQHKFLIGLGVPTVGLLATLTVMLGTGQRRRRRYVRLAAHIPTRRA